MDHGSSSSGIVLAIILLELFTTGLSDLGEFQGLEWVESVPNSSSGEGSTNPLRLSAMAAGDRGLLPTADLGRGLILTEVVVLIGASQGALAAEPLDFVLPKSGKGAGGLCGLVGRFIGETGCFSSSALASSSSFSSGSP